MVEDRPLFARAARDVRVYLIDDQDNLKTWKTWKDYVKNCVREEWPRRLPNKGLHPYRRHPWVLPNMEHHNLDEMYDLYLLTGDDRARRCLETIAAHAAISSTFSTLMSSASTPVAAIALCTCT